MSIPTGSSIPPCKAHYSRCDSSPYCCRTCPPPAASLKPAFVEPIRTATEPARFDAAGASCPACDVSVRRTPPPRSLCWSVVAAGRRGVGAMGRGGPRAHREGAQSARRRRGHPHQGQPARAGQDAHRNGASVRTRRDCSAPQRRRGRVMSEECGGRESVGGSAVRWAQEAHPGAMTRSHAARCEAEIGAFYAVARAPSCRIICERAVAARPTRARAQGRRVEEASRRPTLHFS